MSDICRVLVEFHRFASFNRLAKEFGLQLVKKVRFDDFFHEHSDKEEYKTLLNRMQALEVGNHRRNTDDNKAPFLSHHVTVSRPLMHFTVKL